MNTPAQGSVSDAKGVGLFRTADGRNLFVVFVLVTSLFIMWGFCNGLIDVLNKHFQEAFQISKQQSGLVQFANYLAYFLMAIPAGMIATKLGYKGGIITGLALIAMGASWMMHAVGIGQYSAFLLGLFIIALGMTCLETIANPYTTVLGPPESGTTRINIAQTFNGLGWILGPFVGRSIFSGATQANANAGLSIPYLGIAVAAAVLLVVFAVSKVPDLHAVDESAKAAEQRTRVRPSSGQLAVIALVLAVVCWLLYFFISPILDLFGVMLSIPSSVLLPTKYVLLVAAWVASFILVSNKWDMFRRKHYTLGIGAQFLYVAAQAGIFGFFQNYVIENAPSVTSERAAIWLTMGFCVFAFGRLCGSGLISQFKPHLVLAAYAAINVVLSVAMMAGGTLGLVALFGTFFFMSVMFPTIFSLGIRGLGDHTKLGSSLIVMSIIGGAIAPPFMGHIADVHSMRVGMAVPLMCFVLIALYGLAWRKLEARDAGI